MSQPLKFAGLEVQLGGTTYVMPPLSAKAAKAYWPRMLALQAGTEEDVLDLGAGVAHACLARNYPEITREQVDELVDLGNVEELLAKAGGNGSFKRWTQQQLALQAAEGNAATHPPAPAAGGTGAASTPASPPPPGGASPTSTS
jgi:hypothetical protein